MDARRTWLAAWLLAVLAHVLALAPLVRDHAGVAIAGCALDLPLLAMVGIRLWRMRDTGAGGS